MQNLVPINEIFDVIYGTNLELNALELDPNGINFVSRTSKNNGVSAKVKKIELEPILGGVLSVACGGSVLETFLQRDIFYSGRDIVYLRPKFPLNESQKLYFCQCIRANKFRFNYGRQANKTLKDILIPSLHSLPKWLEKTSNEIIKSINKVELAAFPEITHLNLDTCIWKSFEYQNIFSLKKGKRLTKANMKLGNIPFIGAIDSNNGYSEFIDIEPNHSGNTITVNYNGSVGEAFYQPTPFWASDDVNVLYPKFKMTPAIALFLCTLIRAEKYRFSYGRKWHLERMATSIIKLPVKSDGKPDWDFMDTFIKSLPFSSQLV